MRSGFCQGPKPGARHNLLKLCRVKANDHRQKPPAVLRIIFDMVLDSFEPIFDSKFLEGIYILLPLETSCFCGVTQPLNLNPLASLNILYLAASAPLALIQIQGASLQNPRAFKWKEYILCRHRPFVILRVCLRIF